MAVRLRLMRMGKKKQPTYRIVAADSRSPRDGRFLQIIGTYDPRHEPSALKVDNEAALEWLQKGARPSEAVEKLLKISGVWESYTTGAPLPAQPDDAPSATVEPGPAPAESARTEAAPVPPSGDRSSDEGSSDEASSDEVSSDEVSSDEVSSDDGSDDTGGDATAPVEAGEGAGEGEEPS